MKHKNLFIALIIPFILASCTKDKETAPEPVVESFKKEAPWVPERAKLIKSLNFTYHQVMPVNGQYPNKDNFEIRNGKGYVFLDEKFNVVYVVNWPTAPTHGSVNAKDVYFNLDTRDSVGSTAIQDGKADNWHIKFQGIYNSTLSVNADPTVLEKGLIRTLDTSFNELDVIPAIPSGLQKQIDLPVSMHQNGSSWGYYESSTHIVYPNNNKTNIIYLKDGRRVKFQLTNLYLDNPAKVKDKYEYPAPFLSFKYFITTSANSDNVKTR